MLLAICIKCCVFLLKTDIENDNIPTYRSVSLIDSECRQVNDKLRRLAVVLPDVSSLAPLDYDCTIKRADIDVLQTLVEFAKNLKVCNYKITPHDYAPSCTGYIRVCTISYQ